MSWTGRHLFITRGTSWLKVYDWRVLELRGEEWHLLTCSSPLAQYNRVMTPIEAVRLAARQFPGARLYMRTPEPNAPPCRGENITVGLIVATMPGGLLHA